MLFVTRLGTTVVVYDISSVVLRCNVIVKFYELQQFDRANWSNVQCALSILFKVLRQFWSMCCVNFGQCALSILDNLGHACHIDFSSKLHSIPKL